MPLLAHACGRPWETSCGNYMRSFCVITVLRCLLCQREISVTQNVFYTVCILSSQAYRLAQTRRNLTKVLIRSISTTYSLKYN